MKISFYRLLLEMAKEFDPSSKVPDKYLDRELFPNMDIVQLAQRNPEQFYLKHAERYEQQTGRSNPDEHDVINHIYDQYRTRRMGFNANDVPSGRAEKAEHMQKIKLWRSAQYHFTPNPKWKREASPPEIALSMYLNHDMHPLLYRPASRRPKGVTGKMGGLWGPISDLREQMARHATKDFEERHLPFIQIGRIHQEEYFDRDD